MKDVQNERDTRELPLNRVGIRELEYPVRVLDPNNEPQRTIAKISLFVDLAAEQRGIHMSRLIEVLNQYHQDLDLDSLHQAASELCTRLEADRAEALIEFPYVLEKLSPVTKTPSYMTYGVEFFCRTAKDSLIEKRLSLKVPVTSLCPCSKEISEAGAHNQRSLIQMDLWPKQAVSLESLIRIAEQSASSELYALMKRPDEKYATEQAYFNPAFAEDIVRAAAQSLVSLDEIEKFRVSTENFESIHAHNAFAEYTSWK